jgi:hypothetical protein
MSIYLSRVRALLVAVGVVLVFFAGYMAAPRTTPPLPVISNPAPGVTTIRVPVPVITEKTVTQYIQHPEDNQTIAALMRENAALKVRVDELSISVAHYESQGGGTVETTPPAPTPTPQRVSLTFKDWRLTFTSDGSTAKYTLHQTFSIINTVGKNARGIPTNLIRLYEVNPQGQRIPITTTETTTIAATANLPRWTVAPRLQAGLSATIGTASQTQRTTTGMIAVSLLRRGTSHAPEDTRWAVLSPAITFSGTERSIGVLPASFNIGSLPKQPFTNIWISPYVGTTGTTRINRLGIALTATF